jgi:hypothetical protein
VVNDFVLPTFNVDGVMDYSSFAFGFPACCEERERWGGGY